MALSGWSEVVGDGSVVDDRQEQEPKRTEVESQRFKEGRRKRQGRKEGDCFLTFRRAQAGREKERNASLKNEFARCATI